MTRRDVIRERINKIDPYKKYTHNAIGFSQLFADVYKYHCRFNRNAGKWFYYDGKTWQADLRSCETMKYLKEFVGLLKQYAIANACAPYYMDWIGKLSGFYYRDHMIKDSSPHHYFDSSECDNNPMLLNCQNGTLCLETFTLKPHNPNDKLTKISNVSFDQNAQAPRWLG